MKTLVYRALCIPAILERREFSALRTAWGQSAVSISTR